MQIGVELTKAVENKRIFIVDDDEIFRAALQFMLHDEYEAHEIAGLEAALSKAQRWRPDLVVIAESVVRARGLSLFGELAPLSPGAKTLVVVDALGGEFGEECRRAGADGYISKPLKVEFVRQKVDALLGRRKSVTIPLSVLTTK